jgi:acetyl-CoA synthetase
LTEAWTVTAALVQDGYAADRRGDASLSTEKSDILVHKVPANWAERAHVNASKYNSMYAASVSAPETFWAEHGKRINWIKQFTKVKNTCFDPGNVSIKWFEDGTTNVAMNCIDRHLAKRADQVAIIWEGDDPSESKKITYRELHES